LWGFLTFLSTPQTFHIHVGLGHGGRKDGLGLPIQWYSCLHFPTLSLTPAFSTPAIWCHVFHSRVFSRPSQRQMPLIAYWCILGLLGDRGVDWCSPIMIGEHQRI